ncbi:uncharacterized protein LOC117531947 [Thalassophryne amazonica]|uniref:uncharacterized protein LOC117531947 n=1 Tax=Thalassophryne amazonica TaxID=390379 RepID=UPI0014713D92|nr:uncharacterized protein LOC117531947 [Thalassophryne amazonica]
MLDHGHIKASLELLLSLKTTVPWLSWQHRCILQCLLRKKQPRLASRYLHWTKPALENLQDVKLCAEITLQNSHVSGAWAPQREAHTESDNMAMHVLQDEGDNCSRPQTVQHPTESQLPLSYKGCSDGIPPCPLSSQLYQAQRVNKVSPEELVRLHRKAVMEVRKPHPPLRDVVWPELTGTTSDSKDMFLPAHTSHHLISSRVDIPGGRQTAPAHQPERETSSESQPASISSFTFFSSPLLKHVSPSAYERTLTLQRISPLLADGEIQNREQEDKGRTPSSTDATTSSLWKEESTSPRHGGVSASGTTVGDTLTLHKRLNLHHQCCSKEDIRSASTRSEHFLAENQIFHSADCGNCWIGKNASR